VKANLHASFPEDHETVRASYWRAGVPALAQDAYRKFVPANGEAVSDHALAHILDRRSGIAGPAGYALSVDLLDNA